MTSKLISGRDVLTASNGEPLAARDGSALQPTLAQSIDDAIASPEALFQILGEPQAELDDDADDPGDAIFDALLCALELGPRFTAQHLAERLGGVAVGSLTSAVEDPRLALALVALVDDEPLNGERLCQLVAECGLGELLSEARGYYEAQRSGSAQGPTVVHVPDSDLGGGSTDGSDGEAQ